MEEEIDWVSITFDFVDLSDSPYPCTILTSHFLKSRMTMMVPPIRFTSMQTQLGLIKLPVLVHFEIPHPEGHFTIIATRS